VNRPIYLDHAATSFPKAPGVVEAVARHLERDAGNPGRGGHRLTLAASRAVEGCREAVAALLSGDPERTLLGPGATFWLNTVLESFLGGGGRAVVSALEHNAVMRPLRHLEALRDVTIAVVHGVGWSGVPSPAEVVAEVRRAPTTVVVLNHASNVSGAVLPVAEIARAVAPVPVVVDAAQTAGSLPIDFAAMGVAALACSGHKGLLGPAGTGVLLLDNTTGERLEPLVRGGTGSRSESEEMPGFLPDRLEPGTPNTPGLAGLEAACHWLARQRVEGLHRRQMELRKRLAWKLMEIPGVHLWGYQADAPAVPVLSFTVDGVDNGELAAWLDRERGLMLRVGLHCAPATHRRLGSFPDGTLRAGIGPFLGDEEVDALAGAVEEAVRNG